ncbi:MAG: hypothetical protein IT379_40810 [Deltaproteobacteria bacterium]|nr:hypothetical protein [Deltaproteobacteria bacterium]
MKHASLTITGALVALASLASCGDDDGAGPMDAGTSRPDVRADVPRVDAGPPPPPSANWCDRIRPGEPGEATVPIDLAVAHGAIRFFGAEAAYSAVDQSLAGALGHPLPFDVEVLPVTLATYASALDAVCARAAQSTPIGNARVERADPAVIVRPGTGSFSLPADVAVVAIDLRDLPNVPNLATLLEAAVAPTLASPIPRPSRRVRTHYGMTDELLAADNVFSNRTFVVEAEPIPARGDTDRTLVLLTGESLPPAAAELAGTLRLAGRAWIVGYDVHASVAEARWHGVGEQGLAYRTADLLASEDVRWPDVIPADADASRTSEILTTVTGPPPEVVMGAADRAAVTAMTPFGDVQPPLFTLGPARAALMTAHAAARLFHPYSQANLDALDGRLEETLGDLDGTFEPDAELVFQLLRRFAHVLSDGQARVVDQSLARGLTAVVPLVLERIGEDYVVRRSGLTDVLPGEVLVSLDGMPMAERVAVEQERTSAATNGHRLDLAMRNALVVRTAAMLGVRATDATMRDVVAIPVTREDYATLLGSWGPPNGRLDSLGAPDFHYVNLDVSATPDLDSFLASLTAAEGALGLVLDLRGFLVLDSTDVAARLLDAPEDTPRFRFPTWVGPDEASADERQFVVVPEGSPSFLGPIVLLVGPSTLSVSENLAAVLVAARRTTLVGRQTAGTSGGVCGLQLPGSFAMTMTCTEVRLADGDAFHGIGLRPDASPRLTAALLAAGTDPDLARAIVELQ